MEIDKIALMHDPYAVAWKQPQRRRKVKEKL